MKDGDVPANEPREPCQRLKKVPLVRVNSVIDPNLGLHLIVDACPLIDRTLSYLGEGALEGLVLQVLSLFSQVLLTSLLILLIHTLSFFFLTLKF